MESILDTFEIQIDEKPNGCVIRVNDENQCVIRICGIPHELVFDKNGERRDFIDITYPRTLRNTRI